MALTTTRPTTIIRITRRHDSDPDTTYWKRVSYDDEGYGSTKELLKEDYYKRKVEVTDDHVITHEESRRTRETDSWYRQEYMSKRRTERISRSPERTYGKYIEDYRAHHDDGYTSKRKEVTWSPSTYRSYKIDYDRSTHADRYDTRRTISRRTIEWV